MSNLHSASSWAPRESADPVLHSHVTRTTKAADMGNSNFYAKPGIVSVTDQSEGLGDGLVKFKKITKIYEGSTKFPKLQECAHFHYDVVELDTFKVVLQHDDQENVHRGHSFCEEDEEGARDLASQHAFYLQVSSQQRQWAVRRTFQDMRMLDRQLHRCIFDRKYSLLPELREGSLRYDALDSVCKDIRLYFQRFSSLAGDNINCGPILSWFEMDNRGNRLIVTDESGINTPAVAAAHVVKRYTAQAPDEISFEVGDIISIIGMPLESESAWWRGKRNFEVGFFPCDCVEVIKENIPHAMTSKIPQTPPKAVLRKRGKLISLLRTFFTQRPARAQLQRSGIVKERVFGCDLGENLLNSGLEVPQILKTCAETIEVYGIVDGIYRLSGVASNIQKLRVSFDEESVPNLTEEIYIQDIHSISSVVKAYFRELPNPLFTYQLYHKFCDAIQDEENKLLRVHDAIQQLPPPHYRTAKFLLQHLSRVASFSKETGMHIKNLAICWAPNLLRCKELEQQHLSTAALQGVCVQAVVTEFLISYVDVLFSDNFHNLNTGGTGSRRPRPKSLAISTPAKLLSLEEARERAITSSPTQKYIEVGGGPSNLPDRFHTVIDMPKKKSVKDRKSGGWKALFSRSRSNSWRTSKDDVNMELPEVTAGRRSITPGSEEAQFMREESVRRRGLRSVHSYDSLLSGHRLSATSSDASHQATTITNPYAEEYDSLRSDRPVTLERMPRAGSGRSSKKRSISCEEYTYEGSASMPHRPTSDGSSTTFNFEPQQRLSSHSIELYFSEPGRYFPSSDPEPPPVPSRASRISQTRSRCEDKPLPPCPDPPETEEHFSCSPPADPKRSRPMDDDSSPIDPPLHTEPPAKPSRKNSKLKTTSPGSKKKKKAAPPPPISSPEEEKVSPDLQTDINLELSRRQPVTQLFNYEALELHGMEAAQSGISEDNEYRSPVSPLSPPAQYISPPSPLVSHMDLASEVSKSLDCVSLGSVGHSSGENALSPTPAQTSSMASINSDSQADVYSSTQFNTLSTLSGSDNVFVSDESHEVSGHHQTLECTPEAPVITDSTSFSSDTMVYHEDLCRSSEMILSQGSADSSLDPKINSPRYEDTKLDSPRYEREVTPVQSYEPTSEISEVREDIPELLPKVEEEVSVVSHQLPVRSQESALQEVEVVIHEEEATAKIEPSYSSSHKANDEAYTMFHMDGFSDRGARSDSADNLSMSCDSCDELDERMKSLSTGSIEQLGLSADGPGTPPDEDLSSLGSTPRGDVQRKRSIRELMSQFESSNQVSSPPKETSKPKPAVKPRAEKTVVIKPLTSQDDNQGPGAKSVGSSALDVATYRSDTKDAKAELARSAPAASDPISQQYSEPVSSVPGNATSVPSVSGKVKSFEIQTGIPANKAYTKSLERVKPKVSFNQSEETLEAVSQGGFKQDVDAQTKSKSFDGASTVFSSGSGQTVPQQSSVVEDVTSDSTGNAELRDIQRPDRRESLSRKLKRLSEQRKKFEEPENLPAHWRQKETAPTTKDTSATNKDTRSTKKETAPVKEIIIKKAETKEGGTFATRHSTSSKEDLRVVGSSGEQTTTSLKDRKQLFETNKKPEVTKPSFTEEEPATKPAVSTSKRTPERDTQPVDKVKPFATKPIVLVKSSDVSGKSAVVSKPPIKSPPSRTTSQTCGGEAGEESAKVNVRGLSRMFEKH